MIKTLPEIKYDFPKNGTNPFDVESNDNFFIYASGFSKLGKDEHSFKFDSLTKNVPLGYKTIVKLKRIIIINEGNEIEKASIDKNLKDSNDINIGKFYLLTNIEQSYFVPQWERESKFHSIPKPESDIFSLNSSVWNNYTEANNYAKKISIEKNVSIIIGQVIETVSWH